MVVTLSGMVRLVMPLQLAKARCPMLVTFFGIVMVTKERQASNAQLLMAVTPVPMVTSVSADRP